MSSRAGTRTLVTTDEVMGTVVSIHVVVPDDGGAGPARTSAAADAAAAPPERTGESAAASRRQATIEAAVAGFLETMHADDAMFSPFKADSAISRIRSGELSLDEAPALVRDVEAACLAAREATGGRFDAWWQGWFDPTGYVKGWSVERAFVAHLLPLLAGPAGATAAPSGGAVAGEASGTALDTMSGTASGAPSAAVSGTVRGTASGAPSTTVSGTVRGTASGALSVGVSAGGDLRVATRPDVDRPWRIGIADPGDPARTLGTVELSDGAVATSGTAERGEHVFDPAAGTAATTVTSATVVADTLDVADLWATTAVIAGFDDLSWITAAPTRSGLLVAPDGRTRRWAGVVELTEV